MRHPISRIPYVLSLLSCIAVIAANAPEKEYSMHWINQLPEHTTMFSAFYCDGSTGFTITCKDIIPKEIPLEFHSLFTAITTNHETLFQYIYGLQDEIPSFSMTLTDENSEKLSCYNPDYHVHHPLSYQNVKAQEISERELQNILHTQRCALYTGAGISAPVIPTMTQLEEKLGMLQGTTKTERIINTLSNALRNPEKTTSLLQKFFEACLYAKPTDAHKAIASHIINNPACMLFTENLDTLHEQSGSPALRIQNPTTFKECITPEQLQTIDVIICIGLSHDDRGFLGYYRAHNPEGIIIALALEQPAFVSATDCCIAGDAQIIIPALMGT